MQLVFWAAMRDREGKPMLRVNGTYYTQDIARVLAEQISEALETQPQSPVLPSEYEEAG